jgi:hypothetical protein
MGQVYDILIGSVFPGEGAKRRWRKRKNRVEDVRKKLSRGLKAGVKTTPGAARKNIECNMEEC